jgi:hypothetical protein
MIPPLECQSYEHPGNMLCNVLTTVLFDDNLSTKSYMTSKQSSPLFFAKCNKTLLNIFSNSHNETCCTEISQNKCAVAIG